MSSSPLFTLSFSLSLSSFTFSSPPHLFISHSPPPPSHLFISLNSSSPMGFSTLCLFISYGVFPHLFTSPIDCTLNLLFKLSTTHCPTVGDVALEIFFTPYASMVVCIWKMQFFLLFCSLIWFVDFLVCVITRIVVFIFIFLLDLWVLNLCL